MGLTELHNLVKRWRKRREKLRKSSKAFAKNKTKANEYHSNIEYGRFMEIEKCASELIRVLNRMVKDGMVHKGTAQHSKEQLPKYANRCLLYCQSYKEYYHDGDKITPSYCIRLKRSILSEHNNLVHPEDCPVNNIRILAGLKEIKS